VSRLESRIYRTRDGGTFPDRPIRMTFCYCVSCFGNSRCEQRMKACERPRINNIDDDYDCDNDYDSNNNNKKGTVDH
jgi:hypothetical protein